MKPSSSNVKVCLELREATIQPGISGSSTSVIDLPSIQTYSLSVTEPGIITYPPFVLTSIPLVSFPLLR
jgi:hypothetical protein